MAPKATTAEELTDAPAGGPATVADAATVARMVAELVRLVAPSATNIRIQYDVPQGKGAVLPGVIPLPVIRPRLSDLASSIFDVLEKLMPGEWMNGAALAAEIDPDSPPDHTTGTWRRAVDELKGYDLIDSHPRKGYCRL